MNETQAGVPASEIIAKDFITVRAALVKRLGGANEALVWSRVYYRCDEDSRAAYDTLTGRWWAATYDVLAAETGLTPKQVRGALDRLVGGGFLRAEQHRIRSNYDQTYSYQPVIHTGQMDLPSGANEAAPEGNSHLPSGANALLSKNLKTEEDVNPQTPTTDDPPTLDLDVPDQPSTDDLFDQFWTVWPRKEAKKTARKAFDRALAAARQHLRDAGLPMSTPTATDAEAAAFITDAAAWWARCWVEVERRALDRIPHPSTWLNGERWTDERPTAAAFVDQRRQTRTEQNLDVVARYQARESAAANTLELES